MDELAILKTREELVTQDIYQMQDYLEIYIDNQKKELSKGLISDIHISPLTIDILAEVVNVGMSAKMNTFYVANFDALPKEFKDGLGSKYKLGESLKVEGDARAVLVNEHGVRVRDLTLKKVKYNPDSINSVRNILIHIQMKQIEEKLDILTEMLRYQIQRDRSRDLIEPFFKARGYIVDAQDTDDEKDRFDYLNKALDLLKSIIQSGYQDMRTCSDNIADRTRLLLFRKEKLIKTYMNYICEDVYVINKSIGLEMLIYDYMGKEKEKDNVMDEYIGFMHEFSTRPIGAQKKPAIDIIQNNFPYNSKNNNMWFEYKEKLAKAEKYYQGIGTNTQTVFISMEE